MYCPGNDGHHLAVPLPFTDFLQTTLKALQLGIGGITRTVMLNKNARKKENEDDNSIQCAHPPQKRGKQLYTAQMWFK